MGRNSTSLALYISICLQGAQNRHSIITCIVLLGVSGQSVATPLVIPCGYLEILREKMGELLAAKGNRLFGLYDELSAFLTQLNLYRSRGLSLSHELALFLQLYNGHSWTRSTGMYAHIVCIYLVS